MNTRDLIIEEATFLLRTGGYGFLNFKTISDKLHITRANIHHHFQNKETLAYIALEKYAKEHINIIEAKVQSSRGFVEFIKTIESFIWENLDKSNGLYVCACSNISSDPTGCPETLFNFASDHILNINRIFDNVVKKAIKSGDIKSSKSLEEISVELNLLLSGINSMSRFAYKDNKIKNKIKGALTKWAQALGEIEK